MSLDLDLIQIGPYPVFDINITHNLNRMARALGVYNLLWHPEKHKAYTDGKLYASDCIEDINKAIKELSSNLTYYQENYGPENGWGSAQGLLDDLREIRQAMENYPNSYIEVSI